MKKNIFYAKLGVLLLMLVGSISHVYAADFVDEHVKPTLTAESVSIAPGEVAEVAVDYDSIIGYSAFQLRVALPEGLSFEKTQDVDADGEPVEVLGTLGDACLASVSSDLSYRESDNTILFIVYNMNLKKMLKKGTLVKFKVKADDKLAESAEIKLFDIKFSGVITDGGEFNGQEYNSGIPYMTMTVPVKKNTATGINAVNADNQKVDAIYTISGSKVSKATKGVNIVVRNGKAIKIVK